MPVTVVPDDTVTGDEYEAETYEPLEESLNEMLYVAGSNVAVYTPPASVAYVPGEGAGTLPDTGLTEATAPANGWPVRASVTVPTIIPVCVRTSEALVVWLEET